MSLFLLSMCAFWSSNPFWIIKEFCCALRNEWSYYLVCQLFLKFSYRCISSNFQERIAFRLMGVSNCTILQQNFGFSHRCLLMKCILLCYLLKFPCIIFYHLPKFFCYYFNSLYFTFISSNSSRILFSDFVWWNYAD